MEKPQSGLPVSLLNKPFTGQSRMVYFFVYLLKIITSIIKANTTIVSAIKPNISKFIIVNKKLSIICTTSILVTYSYGLKVANHICLFSFPMLVSITYN